MTAESFITRFPPSKKAGVLLLFASFTLAYWPVWQNLLTTWSSDENYAHGFFIVPLSVYIGWSNRQRLATHHAGAFIPGLAIVVVSQLFYLVGFFGEILTLSSLSMVLALGGVTVALWGFGALRELFFPWTLLLFMIPIPSQLYATVTIPLQLLVSYLSTTFGILLGIPIHREGNLISLPGHSLEIVTACSGLRSIISLMTISLVLGYLSLKSNLLRIVLFFSSIPSAVLVNAMRVVAMILAFHYYDYDLTSGVLHTAFGTIIFVLALLLTVAIKEVLSHWDSSGSAT